MTLIDNDPINNKDWDNILMSIPILGISQLFIIIFGWLTEYRVLFYLHVVGIVVFSFSLIIVSGMKSYILAFFQLSVFIGYLFIDLTNLYNIIPDVLSCNSHHCDHGKKWMVSFLFVFLAIFIAATFYISSSLIGLIKLYRISEYSQILESKKNKIK
jgi:hypothetical protein